MEETKKKDELDILHDDLMQEIKNSGREYQTDRIEQAYLFAREAHKDQKRLSGEPYMIHPLAVAKQLVDLGMDSESVMAGLLHDVVEDTPVELSDIRSRFGKEVANLIDGLTKIEKIPFTSREEEQAENVRKMLIAMAGDIRVIIIKLADRVHNMSTLQFQSPQKQRDKARESMEIYAPIAHRLGIRGIKEYLEDTSLRYLDPVAYKEIQDALEALTHDREDFIERTKKEISDRVSQTIPGIYIEGRVKSINGIYRKVFLQGKSIDEIFDIFAVRVIVDNLNDCYNVLGIIHDMFRPLPNRFKDYISTPKANMYQSLHTTVMGKDGIPFEVQIRTWEMHHTAEYGIAAHWKYKLGMEKGGNTGLDQRLTWIRQVLDSQSSGDATDVVNTIKSDLSTEDVFVFTPKGDVISLPAGSNVIDVAYAIHSAVGNRMIGAKVDKRIVSLDYKVKTGEIVEILTTKEAGHGPSRDWLNMVKTSEARNKIRTWFKKERREENIAEGKAMVEREFKRNNIELLPELITLMLETIGRKNGCNTEDDFYAAVGYGGVQLWRVLPRVKEEYQKLKKPAPEVPTIPQQATTSSKASGGVLIDGMDNCLIKFSRCCSPLPGDEIVGFITRGYGVSIHKRSCTNVPRDLVHCQEPERWVAARWASNVKEEFKASLQVVSADRAGLLADVTIMLSNMHLFIHTLNSRELKNGNALIMVTLAVNSIDQLNKIIDKLSKINGVISVDRI